MTILEKLYDVWNNEHPTTFKYFGLIGEAIQEIQALYAELEEYQKEGIDKL